MVWKLLTSVVITLIVVTIGVVLNEPSTSNSGDSSKSSTAAETTRNSVTPSPYATPVIDYSPKFTAPNGWVQKNETTWADQTTGEAIILEPIGKTTTDNVESSIMENLKRHSPKKLEQLLTVGDTPIAAEQSTNGKLTCFIAVKIVENPRLTLIQCGLFAPNSNLTNIVTISGYGPQAAKSYLAQFKKTLEWVQSYKN